MQCMYDCCMAGLDRFYRGYGGGMEGRERPMGVFICHPLVVVLGHWVSVADG